MKHQADRQHTVIERGVYGVVRHPIYAGAILLLVGMPLWLESYAAAMLASVPIGTLVMRIVVEEQFLRRALACYNAYTERVWYRLIPFCLVTPSWTASLSQRCGMANTTLYLTRGTRLLMLQAPAPPR